ncbi:MAG: hypothetical protein U0176_12055 [Bacteroidia bacterium]
MKSIIAFTAMLLSVAALNAQTVLWASKVVNKSSEYSPTQFSAAQILGKPNVFPNPRESPCAWSPLHQDSQKREFIEVEFEKAIVVRQVIVAESFNAGCVTGVHLWHDNGDVGEVRVRDDGPQPDNARWLSIKVSPRSNSPVKRITVYLNTSLVEGYNHIDAIGISDSEEKVLPTIHMADWKDYDAEPINLGPKVNTEYDEIMPLIAADGKTCTSIERITPKTLAESSMTTFGSV